MQYCKNCGRQLKDGVRFCDRCGKSVRQGRNNERAKKQEQIEKLQKDRIKRKKQREEREAEEKERRARKSEVRRSRKKVIIIASACIAAVVIIAVVSYIMTTIASKDEEWKTSAIGSLDTTAIPTMQPSETQEPATQAPASKRGTYSAYILSNDMTFSYPDTFDEEDIEGDEELRFSDENGAVIEVYMTEYPGGTPESLMQRYSDTLDGDVNYSLTGTDWYTITVQHGDIVTHRKYVIDRENDLSVYYDLEFDVAEGSAEDYEEYMDYMDAKFGSVKASKADEESD